MFGRLGIFTVRGLLVGVRLGKLGVRVCLNVFEPMDLVERVVVCLLKVEPRMFCEPVMDGLRITGVLADRLVLTEPREKLDDIPGREIVVRFDRLPVELRLNMLLLELRLDVIDLERLGAVLGDEILGVTLRLETVGALDGFELDGRGLEVRLELLLFREFRAARRGLAVEKAKKAKMMRAIFIRPWFLFLFLVNIIGLLSSPDIPKGASNAFFDI